MKHRRITYDLVKKEFDERGYILLSNIYKNNSARLYYICPKHANKGILETTFANFTQGKGCPYCAKRVKKTQEEYEAQLKERKPTIKCLGKYETLKTKIEHMCLVCGYHWYVKPDLLLNSSNGCPKCGKRAPLTHADLIERVAKVDNSIEVVDTYKDYNTKIAFKCKKCKHIWYAKPNNILSGKGCPFCKASKGEKRVSQVLDKLGVEYYKEYSFSDCRNEHVLPFDFYIPSLNTCIEYDGRQHFEPCTINGMHQEQANKAFADTQFRDSIKTRYCEEHDIKLLRISYLDYDNVEEIILSFLS